MIESTLRIAKSDGLRHKTTDRSQPAPFLPHRAISARTAIWSLLLGVALACPAFLLPSLFPVSPVIQQRYLQITLFPGFAVLSHVFLGPLIEELVYRGLFLQLARRYMPVWLASVLSTAVFAITHLPLGPGIVLLSFTMGCLFCWMVTRSGSLYPGYLCHAVFNYTAMLVISRMFGIRDKVMALAPHTKLPLAEIFPAWWIVLSLVVAATAFVMVTREFARRTKRADTGAKLAANAI